MKIIDDITNYIFVSDKPEKSDIIFLPGSSDPLLPEKAAKLYLDGCAAMLLPAGSVSVKSGKFGGVKYKQDLYDKDYKTEWEFYADVLIKNGVPETKILIEDKSGHTYDNAFFSRKVTDDNNMIIKKAIVCCKSFHARRCFILYQLAYPEAEILINAVDCYGISRDNWFIQEYGIDRVFGELSRCGNQFVGDMKKYLNIERKYS